MYHVSFFLSYSRPIIYECFLHHLWCIQNAAYCFCVSVITSCLWMHYKCFGCSHFSIEQKCSATVLTCMALLCILSRVSEYCVLTATFCRLCYSVNQCLRIRILRFFQI